MPVFEIGANDFLLDGKPFLIRSGELHHERIPREYWSHRLRMCKAMGLNTVCAYLFWNAVEKEPGCFDFTGRSDVAAFCRLAHEEGLWVLVRPGPYACAEWDFGGLPTWLLADKTMRIRTMHPGFIAACRRYLLRIGEELAPLQVSRGGPILMVQVENEYGAYGNDKEYIGAIRDALIEAGFEVPLFTCDGAPQLGNGSRPDLFSVVNFAGAPESAFRDLRALRPDGPLMCGEYYTAWFDHWGQPHRTTPHDTVTQGAEPLVHTLERMLKAKASFSLYMVHGGTSFGFSAGANCEDGYLSQVTSYDYDAPISEAGWVTPKYLELRELFARYLNPGESLPDIPEAAPVISIPGFFCDECASFLDTLGEQQTSTRPEPFEAYGQNQGCGLYQVRIPAGPAAELVFDQIYDHAAFYLDGKEIHRYDRGARDGKYRTGRDPDILRILSEDSEWKALCLPIPARTEEKTLEVLVLAMGHVNYGPLLDMERKGILGPVFLRVGGTETELLDWTLQLGPMDETQWTKAQFTSGDPVENGPAYYRGSFRLDQTGDTFLDMRGWGKGVVWVNGHNLGRYWSVGPQQTLYLPMPWLKCGENNVVVLEWFRPSNRTVRGLEQPLLDALDAGHASCSSLS